MLPEDTRKRLQVVNNVNPSIRQAATPASFLQGANVNPQGSSYNPQQQTFNPQQTANYSNQSFAPVKPLSVGVAKYQPLLSGGKVINPGPNLSTSPNVQPKQTGFSGFIKPFADAGKSFIGSAANVAAAPVYEGFSIGSRLTGDKVGANNWQNYAKEGAMTGVGFAQGIPRQILQLGESANPVGGDVRKREIVPTHKWQKFVLGDQPIPSMQKEYETTKAASGSSQAKGQAVLNSLMAATLLKGGFEGAKRLGASNELSASEARVLSKTNDPVIIQDTLSKKLGVSPESVADISQKIAETTNKKSIHNLVNDHVTALREAAAAETALSGSISQSNNPQQVQQTLEQHYPNIHEVLGDNNVKSLTDVLSRTDDPETVKSILGYVDERVTEANSQPAIERKNPNNFQEANYQRDRGITNELGKKEVTPAEQQYRAEQSSLRETGVPAYQRDATEFLHQQISNTIASGRLVDDATYLKERKALSAAYDRDIKSLSANGTEATSQVKADAIDQQYSQALKELDDAHERTQSITKVLNDHAANQVPEPAAPAPDKSLRQEAIAQAGAGVPENAPVTPGEASATSVENTPTGLAEQTNANADTARIKEVLDTTKVGTGDVGAKGRLKKFQELFSPVPGQAGEAVQSDLRASIGGLNAEKAAQFADSKRAIDFWKKTSDGDRLNFMQRIQSGEAQPTPDLQAAADYYAERFKQDAELATSINPNFVPIEDYFSKSGIWESPDQASAFAKKWQATPDQFKHQAVPTIYDGIQAGLKLKESNPEIIAVNSRFQLLRAQMLQDFVDNQIAKGVDPEIISKMTDTWLQNQMGNGQLYNDVKSASYALSNMQLGLSGFHFTGTSINSALSRFANGLNDVLSGHPIKGVGEVATSPFAPVIDAFKGNTLRNAASAGEETIYTKLAREANFNLADQPEYRTSGLAKTVEDFQSGNKAKMAKGVAATPFRAFSSLSKPLMEWWVPNLKAGAFQDAIDTMLRQLGPEASEAEIRLGAQKVANSIDNRFGKLQQDNLLWDKTLKDGMAIMTRSPGWNIGTVRELGGGTANLFKKSTYTGLAAGKGLPTSTTYTASLVAGTMMMGTAINYAFTGEAPKSVVDYFYPRTGKTDANGNPERVSLPTYAKDVVAFVHSPAQTAINKSTPLLGLTSQVVSNKDYYGKHIRDTNASNLEQLAQVGGYIGKSAMPFSITGGSKRVDTGPAARFQNFMGLTKAPGYINGATPAGSNAATNTGTITFAPTGNPITDALIKQKTLEANNKKDFMDGLSKDDLKFFKARVNGKNVDISQADIDKAHDGGAISDEDYARATALHQALSNVTKSKIPKVTNDSEGKFAAQFYKKVNALTPDARKAYLEGAPDQQARQAADLLNKQLLPGLKTKINPSNKITNLLANFNKDFSNNPDKTATERRAGMRDLWKNILRESAGDEVGRLVTANENDIRYLIANGEVSKEAMKAAIDLDNEMLAAKLITAPGISNKLRKELGFGAYSSGSSGGGGSRGGGRSNSHTTQLGLSQLLPKTLTFSQPNISTKVETPKLNIGRFSPSDVRGAPRPGRAVSLRTSKAVIK